MLRTAGDGDDASFYEGCLSVPGLTGVVARHRAVHVEALDEHGQPIDQVFSGWAARIVQHEVDHLGGHLYLDRVETRSLSTTGNYAHLGPGGRRKTRLAPSGSRYARDQRPKPAGLAQAWGRAPGRSA